jgi:hypothetical protein
VEDGQPVSFSSGSYQQVGDRYRPVLRTPAEQVLYLDRALSDLIGHREVLGGAALRPEMVVLATCPRAVKNPEVDDRTGTTASQFVDVTPPGLLFHHPAQSFVDCVFFGLGAQYACSSCQQVLVQVDLSRGI